MKYTYLAILACAAVALLILPAPAVQSAAGGGGGGDSGGSLPCTFRQEAATSTACGGAGTSVSDGAASATITGGSGCVSITRYADGTIRISVTGNGVSADVAAPPGSVVSVGSGTTTNVSGSGYTVNMQPHAVVTAVVPAGGVAGTVNDVYGGGSYMVVPGGQPTTYYS